MNSTEMQSVGWLCYRKMSLNQALQASECKQLSPQQLSRFLFSDDFNRRRGVAMSITVSISAVQSHMPNVDADEMSNSRRSLSLISISVGADKSTTLAVKSPTDLPVASH